MSESCSISPIQINPADMELGMDMDSTSLIPIPQSPIPNSTKEHDKIPNKPQRIPEPYEPVKLSHLWDTKQISIDQFCGQLSVWNQLMYDRLLMLEREHENIHHELADLYARLEEVEKGK